jgi:8-oxo-dGTP pyrophosphatase MutT (NUDIX family)
MTSTILEKYTNYINSIFESESKKQAVFIIIPISENTLAATTRPNEENKIGLPGGKVDPGEELIDAVVRESTEEGWKIDRKLVSETPIRDILINNTHVYWFRYTGTAEELSEYKEKHRGILPIVVTVEEISNSGFGNEFIRNWWKENVKLLNEKNK